MGSLTVLMAWITGKADFHRENTTFTVGLFITMFLCSDFKDAYKTHCTQTSFQSNSTRMDTIAFQLE